MYTNFDEHPFFWKDGRYPYNAFVEALPRHTMQNRLSMPAVLIVIWRGSVRYAIVFRTVLDAGYEYRKGITGD